MNTDKPVIDYIMECGLKLVSLNDIKDGDKIRAYLDPNHTDLDYVEGTAEWYSEWDADRPSGKGQMFMRVERDYWHRGNLRSHIIRLNIAYVFFKLENQDDQSA